MDQDPFRSLVGSPERVEMFEELDGAFGPGEVGATYAEIGASGSGGVGVDEAIPDQWVAEFETGFGHILRAISRVNFAPGRRYFSDVIPGRDVQHALQLCYAILRRARSYKGNFLVISHHGDHVHVIHDCPYGNGSCRCKLYEGTEAEVRIRRGHRSRPLIGGLGSRDWFDVVRYFG